MNKSKQMLEDDARFDRLVDGELPAEEYKALLAALDDEPGGWRRCAAAFLEAQALGCELGTIRSQVQPMSAPQQPVAPAKQGGWPRGNLLLAMSASFLVAFILGVSLPDLWNLGSNAPLGGPPIAGQPAFETDRGEFPRAVGNARLVFDGPDGAQSTIGGVPIY